MSTKAYVIADYKKHLYVRVIDPNLAKKQDWGWVKAEEATQFPDVPTGFHAWKCLQKLHVPHIRLVPNGHAKL